MFDTHCHIHTSDYALDGAEELKLAKEKGVENVLVIGEGVEDSILALEFAEENNAYAAIGLHPHQASTHKEQIPKLKRLIAKKKPKQLVAIGECGLDYFYLNSPKEAQKEALIEQIEWSKELDLPLIFHLRGSKVKPSDAYEDFYKIIDRFDSISGVVHSFSASEVEMNELLERGLYIGINGIITFTRDEEQITAVKLAPIDRILVETDAPYLTPKPFRGKINTPQYVVDTARHITKLRGESFAAFSNSTTKNAKRLFKI